VAWKPRTNERRPISRGILDCIDTLIIEVSDGYGAKFREFYGHCLQKHCGSPRLRGTQVKVQDWIGLRTVSNLRWGECNFSDI
jgi:hypothetical protein